VAEMNNFKDFVCHGCLKKYVYSGDYKELVGRKCKCCGFVVWTKEEQNLIEKLERCKDELSTALAIATLSPLERRLFQYGALLPMQQKI
jgi:hypothetical protein